MKTIMLFTRGYSKDEFYFWTEESTMTVELQTEKRTGLIFSYKEENRRLYVVLSIENFWQQVIPYLKSNDFSNALILSHSITKPEIISDIQGINCVLQKNYCTGNGDIHLPPPNLIDNSSNPLDKLLDSVQKKENAYDFSNAFDEVWESFMAGSTKNDETKTKNNILHKCLNPKEIEEVESIGLDSLNNDDKKSFNEFKLNTNGITDPFNEMYVMHLAKLRANFFPNT